MATLIYFIRHGQTEDNRAQRIQGWKNSDLTARGIEVADGDGQALKYVPFTAAYASDLTRAYDTAVHVIQPNVYLDPRDIQKTAGLREVSFGANTGAYSPEMKKLLNQTVEEKGLDQTPLEALRGYIDEIRAYDPTGQAEDFKTFSQRIQTTLEKIVKENPGNVVLVVTHGMFIRTFYTMTFPRTAAYESMHNGGLCRACHDKEGWHFLSYNEDL